jgi:23S rRNA (uridine2552-2'-O)-methyltransferase
LARGKSSDRWLREHFDDPYVIRAQQAGYRSRAVFKLQEINDRDQLSRPGMNIVDPAGARRKWRASSRATAALDILPMEPLRGAHTLRDDCTEERAQ